MAYRVPSFNIWCQVLDQFYLEVGWSVCQLRGPVNGVFDLEQTGTPTSCTLLWEVLFPKGSDVRTRNSTGTRASGLLFSQWDIIRLCGSQRLSFMVQSVGDKAAGFDNEYRLVYVSTNLDEVLAFNTGLPQVNKNFLPPVGYTPLPIIAPV